VSSARRLIAPASPGATPAGRENLDCGDSATSHSGRTPPRPAGRALQDYYSFAGGFAARIASCLLTSADAIAAYCAGYEQAGCDDLVLFPTVADLPQVERLGNALHGLL
jgi:hypothetical protein